MLSNETILERGMRLLGVQELDICFYFREECPVISVP